MSLTQTDRSRTKQKEGFYAGLANNASSNLCFLNSVIQALASITELEDYLKQIKSTQTTIDDEQAGDRGSIIESLLEIINELNTPRERRSVLRATKFIESLRANNASSSRLFNSNQQDAHELLMMILEAVEEEVDRAARLRSSASLGLAGLINHLEPASSLSSSSSPSYNRKILRSPFRGLMANRIACAACGFSAGIRHSPTDHLSITLPVCSTCTLEDCLKEYTILELLDDYVCRKCTLLNSEREKKKALEEEEEEEEGQRKKKKGGGRSRRKRDDLRNELQVISAAIKHQPERDLGPLLEHSLHPIWSPMSTKQTMFARPPRVLTVHVSRSTVMGEGQLMKNYCRLVFPELLILDRFTTTERLNGRAEAPISGTSAPSSTDTRPPSLSYPYRLLALVVHQGNHLSGHYLTFRRSPSGEWYRFSDQDVDRCPLREALDSNPTLLIYQRLGDHDQSLPS
ncbi:hypothetical protein PGTUg99_026407 [Puccinia graminis f. sp. tritici]|uniref:ubiquitinyl hydrolase 1 n=1 Tax=Puccinia graminis f. sp. tritici TaxID=56615 RepID=A0A5B0NG10_PUCGR|nr:hypothetical protein PGTUg99_026407 [Puccinia graminis f. sp. tritici]